MFFGTRPDSIVPKGPAWIAWNTMPQYRLHVSRSPCDRKTQRYRFCQSAASALFAVVDVSVVQFGRAGLELYVSRFGNHCAIGRATSKQEVGMLL